MMADRARPRKGETGRPRSGDLDDAILDAAFRELGRVGYRGMTMAGVARAAGTTRPSVYLRHRSKAELAARAVEHARDRSSAAPVLGGELRADLVAELEWFLRGVLRPNGLNLIGTVLAEADGTPELMARFREHVVAPRRARLRAVLRAAQERGEIDAGAPVEEAARALVGSAYAQALDGAPFSSDWADRTVDLVLDGLRAR